MKNYNNTETNNRIHTIQVTLQTEGYKGNIAFKVGGNCLGASLLESPFEYHTQNDIDKYVINDCNLSFDDEQNGFSGSLIDDDWNTYEFECLYADELNDWIVKLEIIDCVLEE